MITRDRQTDSLTRTNTDSLTRTNTDSLTRTNTEQPKDGHEGYKYDTRTKSAWTSGGRQVNTSKTVLPATALPYSYSITPYSISPAATTNTTREPASLPSTFHRILSVALC